jgi:hypothetical protein
MFSKSLISKIALHLIIMIGVFAFVSQFNTSSASAAAATTCTNAGQFVGVNVVVEIDDWQGKFQKYSSSFSFSVTALVPKDSPAMPYLLNGNAFNNASGQVYDKSGGTYKTSTLSINASKHTHICNKIPTYDFTNGTNGNVLLDCLGGATHSNPSKSAGFAFTPQTVSDASLPGGSFTGYTGSTPSNLSGSTVPYFWPGWGWLGYGYNDLNYSKQITVKWIYKLPKPTVPVQGTVYGHTSGAVNVSSGAGVTKLTGVSFADTDTCKNGTAITDASGSYSFAPTIGNGFCIRAPLKFVTNKIEYSNLKIIPFGSSVTNCIVNNAAPNSISYEYQVANLPNSPGSCNYKLPGNDGYDFLYQTAKRGSVTTTSTVSAAKAYTGQQVTFTNTISSSSTLPDDGTDSYSYSVTDVNRNLPTPSSGTCTASVTTITLIPEITKTITCTVTVPSTMSAGTNLCTQVGVSNGPSYLYVNGVLGGNGNINSCVTVLASPTMSINVPLDYEIGSGAFAPTSGGSLVRSLLVGYTVSCNSYVGTLSLAITAPSAFPGQTTSVNCATSGQSLSGSWNVWNSNIDSYSPGQYVFTGSITGGAPSGVPLPPTLPITANPGTLQIYTVPYARFYGNDIYSGSTVTFNTKNSLNTGTDGSASQYAIIAKGTISMASAAYRSGTSPGLNDLSATALTTSPLQALAGTQGSGSQTVDWGTTGYYGVPTQDIGISAQANVAKKITIVGKDIYINGDITIDQTNLPSSTTPFDDSKIPVVLIVSTGNIYINSSVKRIDALLQAGSDIYTCNNSTNSPSTAVNCTNKLIINGAIGAAQSIHFGRSTGTRLSASANEDAIPKGAILASSSGSAAEVINFPSYLYFASPYITTSSSTRYDALNSVAPLL